MTALVRANARKERAALERLLVLEVSLRDIANASAQSQAELQARIDKGVTDLAVLMETARRTTEDREAALREQINGALQKVRVCVFAPCLTPPGAEGADQRALQKVRGGAYTLPYPCLTPALPLQAPSCLTSPPAPCP